MEILDENATEREGQKRKQHGNGKLFGNFIIMANLALYFYSRQHWRTHNHQMRSNVAKAVSVSVSASVAVTAFADSDLDSNDNADTDADATQIHPLHSICSWP